MSLVSPFALMKCDFLSESESDFEEVDNIIDRYIYIFDKLKCKLFLERTQSCNLNKNNLEKMPSAPAAYTNTLTNKRRIYPVRFSIDFTRIQ